MDEKQEYVCSECGKDVMLDDSICSHCGADIKEEEEDYICTNCGGEVFEDDTICPFCGEDVSEVIDEPVKEFRKRISIFSLKPTKSKDGGEIIPTLEWFDQMINEVYKSRCVVCHMNPLDKDNIQAVKLRFKQWEKQIKAKLSTVKNLISGDGG